MSKITALCFIRVAKGKMTQVLEGIGKIPKVKNYMVVTGDYDGVVELEVDSPEELYDLWLMKIESIEGILETNTHIVMKKVDL
jgi:DNA-binding Lrp family transcriptional regulator